MSTPAASPDLAQLRQQLEVEALRLGFGAIGVAGIELGADAAHLSRWLAEGRHGEMGYMHRHGSRRTQPAELVPGTVRVISARMDYWPHEAAAADAVLQDSESAYVSRYALGRDYHKVLRRSLAALASWLESRARPLGHRVAVDRVFVDSGPVLEKALARNAGLGWIGKHTNLIARDAGSWFFLGEIFTDLPLPEDAPATAHCGTCTSCIPACPTGAITGPHQLDARLCISYLTIELRGSIPAPLRPLIGNRIYGCDDCQLVCPWNKFARTASHPDFKIRHGLDRARLTELFSWDSAQFSQRMAGSAIHRIGHERWLRNIAVAIGNARPTPESLAALEARRDDPSALVREHVRWAIARQRSSAPN